MKKIVASIFLCVLVLFGCTKGQESNDILEGAYKKLEGQKSYSGIMITDETKDRKDDHPVSTMESAEFQVIHENKRSHFILSKETKSMDESQNIPEEKYEVYTEVENKDSEQMNRYLLINGKWTKDTRPLMVKESDGKVEDVLQIEENLWQFILKNKDTFKKIESDNSEIKNLVSLEGIIDEKRYNIAIDGKSNLPMQISWVDKDAKQIPEKGRDVVTHSGVFTYQKFNNVTSIEIPEEGKK